MTVIVRRLAAGHTMPEGFDSWGLKAVRIDGTTSYGFRWGLPGVTQYSMNRAEPDSDRVCPTEVGDGLCVGLTFRGLASGLYATTNLYLVAYREADARRGTEDKRIVHGPVRTVAKIDLRTTKADLRGANFREANFRAVDLRGANFWGADFREATFWGANLRGADLGSADLSGADFRGVCLKETNLQGTNLQGAYLHEKGLQLIDLQNARHQGAYLIGGTLQ